MMNQVCDGSDTPSPIKTIKNKLAVVVSFLICVATQRALVNAIVTKQMKSDRSAATGGIIIAKLIVVRLIMACTMCLVQSATADRMVVESKARSWSATETKESAAAATDTEATDTGTNTGAKEESVSAMEIKLRSAAAGESKMTETSKSSSRAERAKSGSDESSSADVSDLLMDTVAVQYSVMDPNAGSTAAGDTSKREVVDGGDVIFLKSSDVSKSSVDLSTGPSTVTMFRRTEESSSESVMCSTSTIDGGGETEAGSEAAGMDTQTEAVLTAAGSTEATETKTDSTAVAGSETTAMDFNAGSTTGSTEAGATEDSIAAGETVKAVFFLAARRSFRFRLHRIRLSRSFSFCTEC